MIYENTDKYELKRVDTPTGSAVYYKQKGTEKWLYSFAYYNTEEYFDWVGAFESRKSKKDIENADIEQQVKELESMMGVSNG